MMLILFLIGGLLLIVGWLLFSTPTWNEYRRERLLRLDKEVKQQMQNVVTASKARVAREERERGWERS